METSLKLQMDVKNNAEELRSFMLDLNNWEEEMKRKEKELKNTANKVEDLPPPRNKIKRNNSEKLEEKKKYLEEEKKVKRIHAYDYSAWDKYDADKACAELDEESDGEKVKEKDKEEEEEKEKETETEKEKEKEVFKEQEEVTKEQAEEKEEFVKEKKSLKNIDEAFYEKELGNLFVKKEKWEDAIKCYTRAIDLDSKNAIYYSNRALCFIKLKNFKCAEVDATVAIQLDGTYTKAYQRRAVARKALGQHQEAIMDYREILKFDPKNAFANLEISKLENLIKSKVKGEDKKPVKPIFDPRVIFKSEPKKGCKEPVQKEENTESIPENRFKEKEKNRQCPSSNGSSNQRNVIQEKKNDSKSSSEDSLGEESVFGRVPEGFSIVNPVHIPPHLRSKEPLRKIPIKEIFTDGENFDEFINLTIRKTRDSEDVAAGENKKKVQNEIHIKIKEQERSLENLHFPVPVTCVQFQQAWKHVKNNTQSAYSYLKKINADNLPNIFRHSLESDLFSELISFLSKDELLSDHNLVYSFLYQLSKVQRFGSLVLFMSSSDKKNLYTCITRLKGNRSREEVQELCDLYEVKKEM